MHAYARAPAPGPGPGSGALPGPVLFEPGLTGMDYCGSYPLRHPDPNPKRNGSQQTAANSWAVAVQNEPCNRSVGFGPFYPSRSAINSAPFLSIKIHQTPKTLQHTEKEILPLHSEVGLLHFRFRSDFQQEVGILQLRFRSDFQEIL